MKSKIFTQEEIDFAKNIHKEYGKSFYKGTVFFPNEARIGTHVLYAFVRVPDEIVDNPDNKDPKIIDKKIGDWVTAWQGYFNGKEITVNDGVTDKDIMVFKMTKKLFDAYKIPFEYSMTFLKAMMSDAYKKEYENYEELHEYMHGSASVVGMMMTYIVGFDPGALTYADALGDAFQLTNFLRDIDEDYHEKRGRVYMPKDYLVKFGLSANTIMNREYSDQFVDFMKFMIKKNREIYVEADKGIPMLRSYRARLGVTIARLLYSRILNEIEKIEYNVFKGRVRVPKWKRLMLVAWAPVYLLILDFKYLLKVKR